MKIKGKKAQVQITLSPESVQKARELGLNISRVAQNALDEAIRRLESSDCRSTAEGCPEQQDWWGRPDSNRGPERPRLRA